MKNYKAKFMCSYGGEIRPRTDDNKLSYIGGNNRILYVHRNIKFADMLAKLSALFNSADDVSFKYQFPGEGLDALISGTDDDDLDNMMLEYDQLYRASATTARMRLFLFPNNPLSRTLNSGSTSGQPDPFKPNANVNFLFGLDNGAGVPLPPAAVKSLDLGLEPAAPPPEYQSRVAVSTSDRVVASDRNVNHPLEGIDEDGIDDYDDDDDDEESEANTVDYEDYDDDEESEPNTVDYDDYDDEESERNTLGFVDKPMNQWSLQGQFVPSKAGVPVYAPTEKESAFHTPWGTSKHMAGCAAASSRLIGPLPATKYDVFISFRGEDTRTNFTCHLHEALDRKQIKTFIDYELHKGDEISPSLFRAIENAYVSVVVFSENYASSKWCLEELVKILECREKQRQVVIPVFYDIDPSYVRKQNGSYKKAFENHFKYGRMLSLKQLI